MGNKKRIVILSGNHVCHNPRAFKEADALARAGYDVEWLGGWFDLGRAERDQALLERCSWRFTPVVDWTSRILSAQFYKLQQRVRWRLGRAQSELLGMENDRQLGYATRELLHAALARPANLYIAHSESALWAAEKLLHRGRKVGIDMEDWFSEDLLPASRRGRPIRLLRGLEGSVIRSAVYRACPSVAMSAALAKRFECQPVTVVYNSFPWADRLNLDGKIKDRRNRSLVSIHWFSQTIGPGRGLEDLFAALPLVTEPAELHLRGDMSGSTRQWIDANIPVSWRSRIFVQPLVNNDELLSRIAEHDIGFAGEMVTPPSRDLTVTNKILQYLLAGLAVVASNTTGQREVAEQSENAVLLYQSGDATKLAETLNALLRDRQRIERMKAAALRAAEKTFCWERVRPSLLGNIELALQER